MKTRDIIILLSLLLIIGACKTKSTEEVPEISDLYHTTMGQGDPIIVIHGGPGLGSAYLEDHLRDLSLHHQVIFYDQRNSGRSPLTTDSTKTRLSAFLADIDNLRQYHHLDKTAIIGHSWGGLLAMQYAINYPQRVDQLILINSNAADSKLNNEANTRLANQLSADDIEARTQIMRTEAFTNQNPKAYEELLSIGFGYQFSNPNMVDQLQLQLPEDFGKKSQQLGYLFKDLGTYNFTDELSSIACPTLLLYGIDDPMTSFALNSLSQAIPGSQIAPIDDAGHFPFIEKKSETITAITNFLKK